MTTPACVPRPTTCGVRREPPYFSVNASWVSGELLQIHAQLVGLSMSQQLIPGHFAPGVPSHAAEHAAQCGFDPCGDLVVRLAGGDAVDEGALLIPVGKREVVGKAAVGGELGGTGGCVDRILPGPGVCEM